MSNPFDRPSPVSVDEQIQGHVRARRRVLERERDHALAMHRLRSADVSAAREAALWRQIAQEIDAYLAPPVVVRPLLGFEDEEVDWGPP